MNSAFPFAARRSTITRAVVGYCLFWLLVRHFSFALPSDLENPVLVKTGYELFYVFLKGSGLAQLLGSNHLFAWTFNAMLFGSGLLLYLFPRHNILAIIFALLFFVLYAYSNLYTTHSMHYLPLMSLALVCFVPKKETTFSLLWEGLRYIACWAYFSTFLFKVVFGAMWQWDYGMLIFKSNVANYLFLNPDTTISAIYAWFLHHPTLVNIGQKLVFLTEGFFIIGFFTRNYDRWLILCALIIFSTTTFFVEVFFIEQLGVIIFLFLTTEDWAKIHYFFKGLSGSLAK